MTQPSKGSNGLPTAFQRLPTECSHTPRPYRGRGDGRPSITLPSIGASSAKKSKKRAREVQPRVPPAILASLEAILARFPGSEIIGVRRYDLPDHAQLEPLHMAGRQPGTCVQCRDPDGAAVWWLDRRRNAVVWLHTECRRYWL